MLYHFSEIADIDIFVPRERQNRADIPPVVWAINEEMQYTYYFPRNCPRIVYRRSAGMSSEDERRFFGLSRTDVIVTIESGWFETMKDFTIYRYTIPEDSFECFDRSAGYYISREVVRPLDVQPLDRLIERILGTGAELRFTPNLHPLRSAILSSTVTDFGIHRFQNARSEEG